MSYKHHHNTDNDFSIKDTPREPLPTGEVQFFDSPIGKLGFICCIENMVGKTWSATEETYKLLKNYGYCFRDDDAPMHENASVFEEVFPFEQFWGNVYPTIEKRIKMLDWLANSEKELTEKGWDTRAMYSGYDAIGDSGVEFRSSRCVEAGIIKLNPGDLIPLAEEQAIIHKKEEEEFCKKIQHKEDLKKKIEELKRKPKTKNNVEKLAELQKESSSM